MYKFILILKMFVFIFVGADKSSLAYHPYSNFLPRSMKKDFFEEFETYEIK